MAIFNSFKYKYKELSAIDPGLNAKAMNGAKEKMLKGSSIANKKPEHNTLQRFGAFFPSCQKKFFSEILDFCIKNYYL